MRRSRWWSGVRPLVAALVLSIAGCATDVDPAQPDAGDPRAAHAEYARIVGQYGGAYTDPKLNVWLATLGDALAQQAGRPDLRFTVTVLDSGEINAFSSPGGYIYVTRGLLAIADNEAEVAAALAHEMGHIIRGDQRRRWEQSRVSGPAAVMFELFSGAAQVDGDGATTGAVARFTASQEYGADEVGLGIMAGAGYDPAAMVTLLGAIDRDPVLRASAAPAAGAADASYSGSHPLTADRISRLAALATKQPNHGRKTGREQYLAAVDGMTYGGGAIEGFVRRGVLVLPRAAVVLPIPEGLHPHVSPTALVATGDDGSALVLTSARPGAVATPLAYLTQVWFGELPLDSYQPVTVAGRPAAVASTRVDSDRGPMEVGLVAIGWTPSLVYRLVLMAPAGQRAEVDGRLGNVLDSFGPLTEDEARRFPPFRLGVVTARAGDTVAGLARRMAPDAARERSFLTLNRLSPEDTLHPGQQLKIVY